MEKVIVIVGPTCSGKTKLGLILAELLNGEIISADSRQVYKRIDIGTAKPTEEELRKIRHYFISDIDLDNNFDISLFENKSELIIFNILKNNKLPIVIGGSGLYIRALIDGIAETADSSNLVRKELLELRNKFGNDFLFNELIRIDPVSAAKMLPQNWKRVMRALEVFKLTGQPIWKHHQEQELKRKYNYIQIGLRWDREKLYKNIDDRVVKMFEAGLVDEVKNILSEGYSKNLNALNTVGYKEVIEFLDGNISLEKCIELVKRNSRRYAKRQMTWFNADKRIHWYSIENLDQIKNLANQIIKEINERKN